MELTKPDLATCRTVYVWTRVIGKHDLDLTSNGGKPTIWTIHMCMYMYIYYICIINSHRMCVVVSIAKTTYLERIKYFFCYYYYIIYHMADDLFCSKIVIEVLINWLVSICVIMLSCLSYSSSESWKNDYKMCYLHYIF